jgi:hypothetical protein
LWGTSSESIQPRMIARSAIYEPEGGWTDTSFRIRTRDDCGGPGGAAVSAIRMRRHFMPPAKVEASSFRIRLQRSSFRAHSELPPDIVARGGAEWLTAARGGERCAALSSRHMECLAVSVDPRPPPISRAIIAFVFGAVTTSVVSIGLLVAACGNPGSTDGASPDDGSVPDGGPVSMDGQSPRDAAIPTLHRANAVSCSKPRPRGSATSACHFFGQDAGLCSGDQDCTSGLNGRCECLQAGATTNFQNTCTYDDCASDSDCNGGACACRESPIHANPYWGSQTKCLAGNCHTDSDCGSGGYCSPSPELGCGPQYWYGYYCHTPIDECANDTDCDDANAYCAYDAATSHWICSSGLCPDG